MTMDDGLARQAGLLTALLAVLLRSAAGVPSPWAVVVAGTLGLVVYGVLAVGPRVARRLLSAPPPQEAPDPDLPAD